MKRQKYIWTGILAALGMLVLILDAKTALKGAADGVSLCLSTVIPSLFPFFIFSILLNNTLLNAQPRFLHPLGRLLGIPAGAEPLMLIGLFGGYPVGAQCITDAYEANRISKADAHRMLGFCSNAGPAFIFGMGSCIFENKGSLWFLWLIHISSALFVGVVLPNKSTGKYAGERNSGNISLTAALSKSVRTMSSVCGWIVIFRVVIAFLSRWCLWLFGNTESTLLTGLLELSNGCLSLITIEPQGAKFVLCAALLGFGGCCVLMQTCSVTGRLGLGSYFPGKVLQCCFSILTSSILQMLIFPTKAVWGSWKIYAVIAFVIGFLTVTFIFSKKRVAIPC